MVTLSLVIVLTVRHNLGVKPQDPHLCQHGLIPILEHSSPHLNPRGQPQDLSYMPSNGLQYTGEEP